jgi:uncharacterized protein DUF4340
VWAGAGAGTVEGLTLHGVLRDVTVERRAAAQGGGSYLWATVKKTTPPPPKPAAPDGGPPANMSVPDEKGTTATTEFPVGEDGEKALARFAPLRAVRDLGKSAARDEYGLGDTADRLAVKLAGATHELVVGARVFGGDDRYVLDPGSGHVYVLEAEVLRPLDAPEFALRESKLHAFNATDLAEVVVRAAGKERALVRPGKGAAPPPPPPAPGAMPPHPGAAGWADAKTPDKPDQSLDNFMERVEQLAPLDYAAVADAASLTPVGTFEYRAKGGKVIGTLELSKKPAPTAGQFDYYVRSERTHVLAKVNGMAAQRVDQDLAQVVK